MLLRVSRFAFWLAALAAVVALAIPTGWETALTGVAVLASLAAFGLWRAALAQLRRSGSAHALSADAAPLTGSALNEAAAMIEISCARAPSFEAALHAVARILKGELGALCATVYRVTGADASHVRVSELIEAQPGLQLVEQRVHRQRSALGQAIGLQHEFVDATGMVALPVLGQGGAVAVIELTGLQIGIDPDALRALLVLAQAELSQRAGPGARPAGMVPRGEFRSRLGENA